MRSSGSKIKKMLLISLAAFCLLAGITTVLIPTILSTRWGNELLVNKVNERIPGMLKVEGFSLSWFGTQTAKGLSLFDPHGERVLHFEAVEIDAPLLTLIQKGPAASSARLKSLFAEIKNTSRGKTNLEESLGSLLPQIHFPAGNSLALANVDALLELPNSFGDAFSIKSSGQTRHGDVAGNFQIDFHRGENQEGWFAEVANFPTGILDGLLSAENPAVAGLLHSLLGNAINLSVKEEKRDAESSLQIHAASQNLSLHFSGSLKEGIFHLSSPVKASLKVTPETLDRLSPFIPELQMWSLAAPTEVVLDAAQLEFPLDFLTGDIPPGQIGKLQFNAKLSLPKAEFFDTKARANRARINDFMLSLDTARNSSLLAVSSEGTYFYGNAPVRYRFDTKVNKPKSIETIVASIYQPLEIKFSIENLSTKIVDDVLGTGEKASNAFGGTLSLLLQSDAQNPKTLRIRMDSEKIEVPLILLNLDQSFPYSFKRDWSGILLADRIVFKNSKDKPTISSLKMPWKISNGFQNIALDFSGQTSAAGQQQGNMSGSLKIDSFESVEKARLALDIKGGHIPAPFLELISGRSEISTLFGPALQLDATVNLKNLEGNIYAHLTGDNGRIALSANISRGFIHLNEPLVLATQGTHELAREVLGKFAPVFGEMVHSDQPIALTISPENFYLPLSSNFRWEDFRIGSAVLEMGKLIFNNAGDVRELLSMLKPARSEQITIWTTPLYFSIDKGVITVYRMDMLIMDRYPIATWGRIDLAQDNVQMVLGVSGTALSQALDIGGLSKDAMIQIPVKGSISNAKIDTSKATTKIGALIAQSSRGPEGLVLGTVLDLVNGKEGKVPPPTTNPLPWAGREISNQQGTVSERDPHRVIPGERKDPMKEIQREASNLLKGFFR